MILPGRGGGGPPSMGGGGGGRGGPGRGLVLPGQAPGGGGGGRLIIPTTAPTGGGAAAPVPPGGASSVGSALLDAADAPAPAANRFRPPPGFMDRDDAAAVDADVASMPAPALLTRLRTQSAPWHQLARLLPALAQKGYDSSAVSEETGVTPLDQNLWQVAGTVHASLVAALEKEEQRQAGGGEAEEQQDAGQGRMTPEVLAAFDASDGADRLYPFRFLGAARRASAAVYVVENGLDPAACEALARALKEWERRPEERRGFSPSPADCLAFKALRDALECRQWEAADKCVERALSLVATESGRKRIEETSMEIREALGGPPLPGMERGGGGGGVGGGVGSGDGGDADADAALARPPRANAAMTLLRLDPDELGVRPMAVVGRFGQTTADDLRAAPRATQEGPFGAFRLVAGGASGGGGNGNGASADAAAAITWVALPQWRALQLARRPAALSIPDCGAVPALTSACGARSDEDRRRFSGPGLLVVDSFVAEGGMGAVEAAAGGDSGAEDEEEVGLAAASAADLDPPQYYLVEVDGGKEEGAGGGGGGGLKVVPGRTAALAARRASRAFGGAASRAVGVVLFLARPPQRDVPSIPTADSMIQL